MSPRFTLHIDGSLGGHMYFR